MRPGSQQLLLQPLNLGSINEIAAPATSTTPAAPSGEIYVAAVSLLATNAAYRLLLMGLAAHRALAEHRLALALLGWRWADHRPQPNNRQPSLRRIPVCLFFGPPEGSTNHPGYWLGVGLGGAAFVPLFHCLVMAWLVFAFVLLNSHWPASKAG
ncbi:hypothetical protein [Pseudomonas fulva]|uniref:hypothetical protein n=1 Tax=Pseudomonas fulva TaxID=47880 RepID=UPI0018A9CE71|nr:hypothetical protein [Pseudomonas fulva]MBF8636032.1 hypothetical protein [Pseudomonas fulva]